MVILQQLINALALGSIYALIALGYTMVYGIVRLINFAHGDVLMLGAFAGYFALTWLGTSAGAILAALVISMAFASIVGITIEKLAYKPLRKAPKINVLITAIGVSIFIENGSKTLPFIGPNPRQFPRPDWMSVNIMKSFGLEKDLSISWIQVVVFIVTILLMISLVYIVNHTKMGKAMRAVSHDNEAALLMGINVNQVISFTFALGASLAAAAGMLYASMFPQITPYMGMTPGLKAFIAAVFGGIGSIPGAMAGGFIIAIAETFTKGFISSKVYEAVAFSILIIILIVKPSGIMGKDLREKV